MVFFQIIIKFEASVDAAGHIAIDDVSFAPECLQTQGRLSFVYVGTIMQTSASFMDSWS